MSKHALSISTAVHDQQRRPGTLSISWGMPERGVPAQALSAYHQVFTAAAALGTTICVASGDHGSVDQADGAGNLTVNVDHPACDPLVLACGGTQIDENVDVVWNGGSTLDQGGWAGGGGVSERFALPDYQRMAGVPASIVTAQPGRGVPDIAMSAVNYFTRCDTYEGPSGGTSAVAPLMAALVARFNQAKGKPVGFLNPFLYAHARTFRDVISGTNALSGGPGGYAAGPGWDTASGLGAPDGTALLNLL